MLRTGRMAELYRTNMDVSKLGGSLPNGLFSNPIQHKSTKQAFPHGFFLLLEVIFHASLEFPGLCKGCSGLRPYGFN